MLPPLLEGYRVKILDGNHFLATEHRLKELCLVADAPLPGKALVILDPQLCLATKVIPCEDGHAQERALCTFFHIFKLHQFNMEIGILWKQNRSKKGKNKTKTKIYDLEDRVLMSKTKKKR